MVGRSLALTLPLLVLGCDSDPVEPPKETPDAGPEPELCTHQTSLDALPQPASYDYAWTCHGEVAPSGDALPAPTISDDCTTGVWPDLDDTSEVCPTVSDVTRADPDSGKDLPSPDTRSLPIEVPVSESGSFRPGSAPASWPPTLRVVSWNLEYTARLDEQLAALTDHPILSTADVYLFSEVDRCSSRSGTRRSARLVAEALGADYAYGIEFVELSIGRTVGGDTGQAIVSRRPLTGVALACHSSQEDWFANDDQPRLGQRVFLQGDVPVGDTAARVVAVHLESSDIFGDKRSVQAKEILDAVQATACDRPLVVAGDFNAPYCGAPELQVLRDAGFIDAVGTAGDTDPTHPSSGFRLDYAWTRGWSVVDGGVVRGLELSDHDPVWVDLALE
jgi:endonuclease/exonuclease/phosphatase family metal-dependent hydrolase